MRVSTDEIERLAALAEDHWNSECRNFNPKLWSMWVSCRLGNSHTEISHDDARIICLILEIAPGNELMGKWTWVRDTIKQEEERLNGKSLH